MDIIQPFEVPLPSVTEDFEKHIEIEHNKRILFSAKFGAGKSTFLDKYFSEKAGDYMVLKLYPINYSVAANEDVFELIKYDLFSELLAKYADKLDITPEDYSTLFIAQSYIMNDMKVYPFIKALLKATVPNGEAIGEVVDAAKEIFDSFNDYQEKIKKNERNVIEDYIDWCEKRKGSIYERDEITSLITDLILRVKSKLDDKPVVLIIDDLDRLDPEHVFRLFNVFSAHNDAITDLNKFGVDKVIFVCDYHNIKLMYKHRYGTGVDFAGYINKFFSIDVFNFNTTKHLLDSIEEILLKKPTLNGTRLNQRYSAFDRNNYLVKALVSLFGDLIRYKFITFRSLNKFKQYFISDYDVTIDGENFSASSFYFITFVNLATQSLSLESLVDALTSLGNNFVNLTTDEYMANGHSGYPWLIDPALYLSLSGKQIKGATDDKTKEVTIDNVVFELSLKYSHELGLIYSEANIPRDTKLNIYKILVTAIKEGERNNLFK